MKYYLYISDAKVDMLLPQIPNEVQQKIASEFKVDIKVISASLKSERTTLDNRIVKLRAVERYLRDTQSIGTLAEPTSWIADQCSAKVVQLYEDGGLVLFGGVLPTMAFCLGGSVHHLVGAARPEPVWASWSCFHKMLDDLAKVYQRPHLLMNDASARPRPSIEETKSWASGVLYALDEANGYPQRIEFLAKRLGEGEADGKRVLVATPLYVALAE